VCVVIMPIITCAGFRISCYKAVVLAAAAAAATIKVASLAFPCCPLGYS